MAKVVVFGTADTASLAHYYLTNDSDHEVVAFSLTKEFVTAPEFEGKPVVAYEDLELHYPPSDYWLFAPMTARRMNQDRAKIYLAGKERGYRFISYISSKATVFHRERIGENCFILEDNTIQPFVTIGNNCVFWSGNHIGHHGTVHDHVFFTSHVVLSGHCEVGSYSFFGVNATIRDYTRIAEGTLVGMGANIQRNTEPYGIYKGESSKVGRVKSNELKDF